MKGNGNIMELTEAIKILEERRKNAPDLFKEAEALDIVLPILKQSNPKNHVYNLEQVYFCITNSSCADPNKWGIIEAKCNKSTQKNTGSRKYTFSNIHNNYFYYDDDKKKFEKETGVNVYPFDITFVENSYGKKVFDTKEEAFDARQRAIDKYNMKGK